MAVSGKDSWNVWFMLYGRRVLYGETEGLHLHLTFTLGNLWFWHKYLNFSVYLILKQKKIMITFQRDIVRITWDFCKKLLKIRKSYTEKKKILHRKEPLFMIWPLLSNNQKYNPSVLGKNQSQKRINYKLESQFKLKL